MWQSVVQELEERNRAFERHTIESGNNEVIARATQQELGDKIGELNRQITQLKVDHETDLQRRDQESQSLLASIREDHE
jgi:hypothetical protein